MDPAPDDHSPEGPGAAAARTYAGNARAAATRQAYAADWRDFAAWCAAAGVSSLAAAPETVGRFLADRASHLKPATLDRKLSAILITHRAAGFALERRHPAIADVWAGIRRTHGVASTGKDPIRLDALRTLLALQPDTLLGVRDASILSLTWAAGLRRSEVAALNVEDVRPTSEGIVLMLKKAKEDQIGRSELKAIPLAADPTLCPAWRLKRWMMRAKREAGQPLYCGIDRHGHLLARGISGATVATVVRRAVERLGAREDWTADEMENRLRIVAAHSLRSGMITEAAVKGVPEWRIAQASRHKSVKALRRYIRTGTLFSDNLLPEIGL